MVIPPNVIESLNTWLEFFRELWWGETPLRIHSRDIDGGGAPDWHPEFARWLFADPPRREVLGGVHLDQRLRTTRAFRKLRRKAPREFDVLYLMVARKPPLGLRAVADALNERAIRKGKSERYDEDGVLILAISGLDKVMRFW